MDRLQHYEIAEKLGEGKHGSTYLAMDTGHQRGVVIKLLDHPITWTAEWKAVFLSRREQLDRIDSARLTRFYSLEESDGQQFAVREYIAGQSLADRVRTDLPATTRILEMSLELATQLKIFHDHGLVHGNITPANVLIDARGRVKLVDHGLGLPGDTWSNHPPNSCGEIVYLAPELFTGGEITAGSDHYSLGALIYLMWTGQPPFPDDDAETLIRTIVGEPVSFDVRPSREIPGVARLLIDKLVAKDPDERFVSTDELLFTLQGMMSLGAEPVLQLPPKKWSPSPRQYLLLSVLAVLLIILWLVITTGGR